MRLRINTMSFSDLLHLLQYEALRHPMHARYFLSACVAVMRKAHRTRDGGMSKLMNLIHCHVAWLVSECMKLRETMPDLFRHFDGCPVDIFPLMVMLELTIEH
jgi:hypothetical protein